MDRSISKLGFYSALLAGLASVGYTVVQLLQVGGIIVYPLDAILIYSFSLGIAPPYLLAMVALHYSIPPEKKIWTHAALLFAVMYAVFVTIMYGVQLATVIPMSLRDPTSNLLTVTPHSFFWTLDALGYISMGISTFIAAFVFNKKGMQKWVRYFFIANGLVVPLIATVYFYPHFSIQLLMIGLPWSVTLPGSLLFLALFFRRRLDGMRKGTGLNKPGLTHSNQHYS